MQYRHPLASRHRRHIELEQVSHRCRAFGCDLPRPQQNRLRVLCLTLGELRGSRRHRDDWIAGSCSGALICYLLWVPDSKFKVAKKPPYGRLLRGMQCTRRSSVYEQPVARRHCFVPCVVEEGGCLGEHLLALLNELAERGIASGHSNNPQRGASFGQPPGRPLDAEKNLEDSCSPAHFPCQICVSARLKPPLRLRRDVF